MKHPCSTSTATGAAALFAILLLAQAPAAAVAGSQAEESAKAARARQIAQQFETHARVLTVFDREGKVVTTVGERAIYNSRQQVFSPDRTHLAAITRDLEKQTHDLWVLDVATGGRRLIASSGANETALLRERSPVWSPDGSHVAYMRVLGGSEGLYRKASSGEGDEELLYEHPGAEMVINDWSTDGRFLTFFTFDLFGATLYALPLGGVGDGTPVEIFHSASQLRGSGLSPDGRFLAYASAESGRWEVLTFHSGGVLLVVPLTGPDPLTREAVEFSREEFEAGTGRFSPDSRFMAYRSDESGREEIYVPPLHLAAGTAPAGDKWQVSKDGGAGMISWRRDGKEIYFVERDIEAAEAKVMAVEITTTPAVRMGTPRVLFRLIDRLPGNSPDIKNITPDGQRFVFAIPASARVAR
jgi:Tol biopolymer transport system component